MYLMAETPHLPENMNILVAESSMNKIIERICRINVQTIVKRLVKP